MEKQRRYALLIQYSGAEFSGSQIQPGQKTIQSEIERALNTLTKENNKIIMAGRTDAGVHARQQVLHFNTTHRPDTRRFVYAMNALLPEQISVKGILEVNSSFHSQKSAKYRWYRYIINNSPQKSVFLRDISLHVPEKLDIKKMNGALEYLAGSHDFSGFKSANSSNPARICNVLYASCRKFSDIIYIDLIANRFLYNMVRIITGTLIKIGQGSLKQEQMLEVLRSGDRKKAGPTAAPQGLTLMSTGYDEKYNLLINTEAINEQNILCKAS